MEPVAAITTLEQFEICSIARLGETAAPPFVDGEGVDHAELVELLQRTNDLARLAKALAA